MFEYPVIINTICVLDKNNIVTKLKKVIVFPYKKHIITRHMSYCHMLQVIAQRDTRSSFQGSFNHCLIIYWSDTAPLHSIWETLPFWAMLVTSLRCIQEHPWGKLFIFGTGRQIKKPQSCQRSDIGLSCKVLHYSHDPNELALILPSGMTIQTTLIPAAIATLLGLYSGHSPSPWFPMDCSEGHKHRRALVPIPDLKAPLHDVYWRCSQCWQECVSLKEQQKALHLAAWPCHPVWIKPVCLLTD